MKEDLNPWRSPPKEPETRAGHGLPFGLIDSLEAVEFAAATRRAVARMDEEYDERARLRNRQTRISEGLGHTANEGTPESA